jgi:ABC-type amino acid transport substrate-binding protein
LHVNVMIKVRQFPGIASLVLVLLLAGCVQPAAQKPAPVSRLAQITGAGVIRVGVAVDLPPFTFFDRQGERRGFDVELVSEIAQRLGVQVAWVDLAYEPLRAAVRERKVDLGIGAIPYIEEWDRDVDFTQPYYDLGQPGPADPGLLYIILPQGEMALTERLNQIIAELQDEGFIQQLGQEYLAPQQSVTP